MFGFLFAILGLACFVSIFFGAYWQILGVVIGGVMSYACFKFW